MLPTRYGKSDYMRMTGLHLLHEGVVSGVLVMTPNRVLRNQMVDGPKMIQSFRLYEAKLERITMTGRRVKGISPYKNRCQSQDREDGGQRDLGRDHLHGELQLADIPDLDRPSQKKPRRCTPRCLR